MAVGVTPGVTRCDCTWRLYFAHRSQPQVHAIHPSVQQEAQIRDVEVLRSISTNYCRFNGYRPLVSPNIDSEALLRRPVVEFGRQLNTALCSGLGITMELSQDPVLLATAPAVDVPRGTRRGECLYLGHWGLDRKPFDNTLDLSFFYASTIHTEALQKILYSVTEQRGCALLTGEYGCGKTALVNQVVHSVDHSEYDIAVINFPIFTGDEFLREVLFQFGTEIEGGSVLKLFHQAGAFFLKHFDEGRRSVLIIDEAQLISETSVYEQLRLLMNLQTENSFLVSMLLVGQPELGEQLTNHPQMDSRIGVRSHLGPFEVAGTAGYIRHRLRAGGGDGYLFTDEACARVHQVTGGTPRRINNLADLCLLKGAQDRLNAIDRALVDRVSDEDLVTRVG